MDGPGPFGSLFESLGSLSEGSWKAVCGFFEVSCRDLTCQSGSSLHCRIADARFGRGLGVQNGFPGASRAKENLHLDMSFHVRSGFEAFRERYDKG